MESVIDSGKHATGSISHKEHEEVIQRFDPHNGEHGHSLENLPFDNTALRELPLDPTKENYVRSSVPNACFSLVQPTPIKHPHLVHYSPEALHLIDLNLKEVERPDFARYFGGCAVLPGSQPAAHCYAGFQFGHFSGQLGDGRAMYLGELVNSRGERWELQLKGAGKTPYSRDADGRAVLRSSIREFLCSEALYHLGVPTTRAGAIVTSDTLVTRDIRYSGNPIQEKATVVLRLAPTFLRFGSFHVINGTDPITGRSGPSKGNKEIAKTLADYIIKHHFTDIQNRYSTLEERVIDWFGELTVRTAEMVALWQCIGWAHGVLNTDNMSVLGLTIDYGPFGFLDVYDPDFICNGSDSEGRYSFKNQPEICKWNLGQLLESLAIAFPGQRAKMEEKLQFYDEAYKKCYMSKMRKKLGLFKELEEDAQLIEQLHETMKVTGADFTNLFRCLSRVKVPSNEEEVNAEKEVVLKYMLKQCIPLKTLLSRAKPRSSEREFQALLAVAKQNPFILQMMGKEEYLMEEIRRREKMQDIKNVNEEEKSNADKAHWLAWLKLYRARLLKETADVVNPEEFLAKRVHMMDHNNPKYILRNYIAQVAIEQAEKGDYAELRRLFDIIRDPYDEGRLYQEHTYDGLPPDWAADLCVTCSS